MIGQDEPHLGTFWGYGMKGDRACPCPRLVWVADRPSWDPARVLKLAQYIEYYYRPIEKIGDRVIWVPR